jgi:nucleoside-diphosphate-sugar epimerase
VSSVSVYGSVSAGELTETTPRQPTRHAYALAKRAAEDIMLDFHRRHGLPVAVVQPTVVYGPFAGTWTVQPVLCLKHKRVVLLEGGSGMCNAVYVDDVTDAMRLAAIREEAVGEAFLVTGPDAVHWSEFYAAYERMLDIKSTVPMTLDEVRAHLRQQRKARGTIAQLRRAVHSPKLHKRLRKLPVVAKLTSEEFWESLRKTPAEETEKPLWIPDESNFDLFTSRARVRCDKARQRLGYQPGFDFQRGMELTAKWVAWANLVEAR